MYFSLYLICVVVLGVIGAIHTIWEEGTKRIYDMNTNTNLHAHIYHFLMDLKHENILLLLGGPLLRINS